MTSSYTTCTIHYFIAIQRSMTFNAAIVGHTHSWRFLSFFKYHEPCVTPRPKGNLVPGTKYEYAFADAQTSCLGRAMQEDTRIFRIRNGLSTVTVVTWLKVNSLLCSRSTSSLVSSWVLIVYQMSGVVTYPRSCGCNVLTLPCCQSRHMHTGRYLYLQGAELRGWPHEFVRMFLSDSTFRPA